MGDYFGEDGIVAETKEIPIAGGRFHVTIGLLSGGEIDECQRILNAGEPAKTRLVAKNSGGAARTSQPDVEQITELPIEFERYREAKLLRGVKSWDLTEKGLPAPIDLAHLRKLTERDRNLIFVELEEFNKTLTPQRVGE